MWWTRVLRGFVNADAAHESANVSLHTAAEEFLRRSLNDYQLPDQAAIGKSRILLEKALTAEQLGDLFAKGYFCVKGKWFTYRIREGHAGNVDALDGDRLISRFCAHPLGRVPVYDVMLAQKLWIETDEEMFLREAAPYPLQRVGTTRP
jgi:hypothetical protein